MVTMMDEVVSPVLHNKVPAASVDRVELPQSLVTITSGAEGTVFGAATPDPGELIQPSTVVVTV